LAPQLVAALYHFVEITDASALKPPLLALCKQGGVKGTLLLASEGINGTIAGPEEAVRAVIDWLRSDPRFATLRVTESWSHEPAFYRMKVRLKKEIVTMGMPAVDPTQQVGTYVKPEDWNALISQPDVVLIDTRNSYETGIGTFSGAIDPNIETFRDFPEWIRQSDAIHADAKVAMFCTGGIRCEKATSFLLQEGVSEVYHLKGGILKYLEGVAESESLWEGECFVFDQRVSVGHGLKPGPYQLCRACQRPLSDEDKASKNYAPGVSCAACFDETTPEQKRSFAERHKQVQLALERNQQHIG